DGVFAASFRAEPPTHLLRRLLEVAAALSDRKAFARVLRRVTEPRHGRFAAWQMTALAGLLDALERRGQTLEQSMDETAHAQVDALLIHARVTVQDASAAEGDRLAAIQM